MAVYNAVGESKELTASGTVKAKAGIVYSLTLTGGSDAAVATLRDGGSAGAIKHKLKAAANVSVPASFPAGINCLTDIYLALSGTDATGYVSYE